VCNVCPMFPRSFQRPSTRSGKAALFLVSVATVATLATTSCNKKNAKPSSGGATTGDSRPVARVDDTVITVGDVQERINKQAPFTRGRYTALDKRKELLDNLIRVEVMAKEAEKRGYDKDPEVVRVKKQQMISRFLQKDFESKLKVEDVPAADVEKYYKEHPEEFNRPDEVRVSQIVVKDKAKADKIVTQARAADRNDPKVFRDLVTKYSEDEDSKARGGDLTSFEKTSTVAPRPVVDAAFELKELGDISPPVKTEQGYHILRLTQKRPGFSRPLPEVKRQIQQRLFRDLRTKALDTFVADLRKKYQVTIDEDNLAKITVDTSGASEPHGPGAGPGAGFAPPGPGAHGPGAPGAMPGAAALPHGVPGAAVPPPAPGTAPPAGAAQGKAP
jgi:peptidyl-prolyl cis-trans isomerase C